MSLDPYFGDPLVTAVFVTAVSVLLSVFSYAKGFMTDRAQALAMVSGTIIGIQGSPTWMIALYLFPVIAFAATKYRFREKEALGTQEGKSGERRFLNILGVSIIPVSISMVHLIRNGDPVLLQVAFLSSVAVSTADTVASEIGPFARKTYMITTMERIRPGPDGGVSALGLAVSTIAAALFAAIGCILMLDQDVQHMAVAVISIVAAAVIGNIADSLVGAVFESKGRITKYANNALTALMGAVAGFLIYFVFGFHLLG